MNGFGSSPLEFQRFQEESIRRGIEAGLESRELGRDSLSRTLKNIRFMLGGQKAIDELVREALQSGCHAMRGRVFIPRSAITPRTLPPAGGGGGGLRRRLPLLMDLAPPLRRSPATGRGFGLPQGAEGAGTTSFEGALGRANQAVENFAATSGRAFGRFETATARSVVAPAESAGRTLETALGGAAKAAGGALKRLAEDGRLDMEDLRKVALAALTDIVRGFQRSLGAAAPEPALGSLLARAFGGGISIPLGFRAAGGAVAAGRPFVVGERGPELFVPEDAGRILPNRAARPPLSPTVVYQIDARGAEAGVERRILRALKAAEDRAVARSLNSVREGRLRGGAFAAAFRS